MTLATPNAPPKLSKATLTPGHQYGPVAARSTTWSVGPIGQFMLSNYKHYNALATLQAAQAYAALIDDGGKMFVSLAGAMSTAELGISLAAMIREDKVHAICPTGANLEEDLFNLVAHSKYLVIPSYRDLTAKDEEILDEAGLPRVTDTSIPENAAMNVIGKIMEEYWIEASRKGESYFPHEYLYRAIREDKFTDKMEIDPNDSWLLAAYKKNLPIFVGGWEDSTLGNVFSSLYCKGKVDSNCIKWGGEALAALARWYIEVGQSGAGTGFFQIGGGIAGDFPICVVPMLRNDLKMGEDAHFWSYFCQITDATTSYGGYSGAVPNEKITWQKLGKETPRFVIESDATIVAPLIFYYVLGR